MADVLLCASERKDGDDCDRMKQERQKAFALDSFCLVRCAAALGRDPVGRE